jgi:MoaA/NifB/PqqE/SkfB family radical SAM enzyme
MNHTLCEYVFHAVFIDRDGEVFACCHKQPASYGNIYRSPLAEILRGHAAQRAREQTINGSLACFSECNLLNFHVKREPPDDLQSGAHSQAIRKLTLALGWFCNINCLMCPQDHAERNFLDVGVLKRHIDWSQVGEIICEGGEPLAAPTVRELWDYLIGIGKKVNFVTNGLVMTPERAARAASHSDYIYISFNAATSATYSRVTQGASWTKLLGNLAMIQEARRAAGSPLRIIGHFTIIEENLDEIPDFLDLAMALGLDIVNFGYNRIVQMGACIDRLLDQNRPLRDRLSRRLHEAVLRTRDSIAIDASRLEYLQLLNAADLQLAKVVWPSGM